MCCVAGKKVEKSIRNEYKALSGNQRCDGGDKTTTKNKQISSPHHRHGHLDIYTIDMAI